MPVRHRFVYEWPTGVNPIRFDRWLMQLSQQEKQEFAQAKQQQILYRKQAIEQQQMVIDHGSYVWRDEESARKNKPTDDVWYRYFKRYLDETQTIFRIEEEQC